MGKLSLQDFDQMAGRLRSRAIGIMKQLDAGPANYRAQVEKDLAARLGKKSVQAVSVAPAGEPRQVPDQVQPCACGVSNDSDARFCKSCGRKLVTV
jgi:hypothetical protein